MIGGVCAGLGEYFNVDPVFLRIAMVLLVIAHGVGILAYLIALIIIPREPLSTGEVKEGKRAEKEYAHWNKFIPGAILILLGLFFFARQHYWWWHVERFWPLLLVALGLFLILALGRKKEKEDQLHESSQI